FGSAPMLEAALADLANPPRNGQLSGSVAALVLDGDLDRLSAHIAGSMEETGLSASAGRSPSDIARRLIEKAELRSVRLSNEAFSALKIEDYKNFLRMHIDRNGVLTIYAIKIQTVPRDWADKGEYFKPSGGTGPELIEAPIVVR
ncbi:MAG: hypothetical protein WAM70_15235, partial [Pyrinomonadaceae bacterium]